MDETTSGRPVGTSRRRFLIGLGAGMAGATSLGALLFRPTVLCGRRRHTLVADGADATRVVVRAADQ